MHVYHIQMHLNDVSNFTVDDEVRKMALEWEDPAQAEHQIISRLCVLHWEQIVG